LCHAGDTRSVLAKTFLWGISRVAIMERVIGIAAPCCIPMTHVPSTAYPKTESRELCSLSVGPSQVPESTVDIVLNWFTVLTRGWGRGLLSPRVAKVPFQVPIVHSISGQPSFDYEKVETSVSISNNHRVASTHYQRDSRSAEA
jgi:hypothetical protein